MVSAPTDPKGRLIAIFVGAVLLPSVALSYVSIRFVPRLAEANEMAMRKQAEKTVYWIEKELAQAAQARALEAARAVGTEKLLDGREEVVQDRLRSAGMTGVRFATLHLDGAASRPRIKPTGYGSGNQGLTPREVLSALEADEASDEDTVPWTDSDGQVVGVLRYRFDCSYVHGRFIRDFFEQGSHDPALVIRVSEPDGRVVYETAPTPDDKFEVDRHMESPSFRGLKLSMRYKALSIEQDIHRWEMWTLALIGFIDLMLGAGLFLVYSNVRRELHLSRLKSDFVANVSHELKTPLALVRLFAETLELGRVPNEDKARQYYRVINKESQRLTQLINNILDFSRIEAGRKEYRFVPTSVAKVVEDVVDSYRFHIEQQGFDLQVRIADDLPEVEADPEALGQALLNLLNNAIKYSRDSKAIVVEVRRDGGGVLVSVTDQGIGIPKGEHKKIFEKFYRGEDSLVHETKGSGLGLPLVRHIMEAHGGAVEVDSAPARGSTFTLVVPAGGHEKRAK